MSSAGPVFSHRSAAALLAAATLLLAACSPSPSSSPSAPTLSFAPCRLPSLSVEIECAHLAVPKNRARADEGPLSIHVARLPANTPHPERDPLVLLAGGPGQAASALAPFAAALVDVRRSRDILLIDQRGTGRSSPLHCAALDEKSDRLSDAVLTEIAPNVGNCLKELEAQAVDPLDYGTLAFVADLEDARRALGVERLNLWAGSYGTRVALEYLRRYAPHVRTLTLDGVMAPSTRITLDAWRSREARLDALLQSCAHSVSCGALKPSPVAALDLLAERLAAPGRAVTVADPRTGRSEHLRLDFDTLLAALQPLLYAPDTAALLPEVLNAALHDDFAPLLALAQTFSSQMEEQLSPALYYAITCAEDVPRGGAAARAALAASSSTSRNAPLAARSFAACDGWPAAALPDDWGTPIVENSVPVLLLAGALDPVTPPAYAREVAATLARHRLVIARGYGHIVSTQSCGAQLFAAFVNSARLQTLDTACLYSLEHSVAPLLWSNRLSPLP